ncbi:MAG: putative porin [Terriglobales bacterium]
MLKIAVRWSLPVLLCATLWAQQPTTRHAKPSPRAAGVSGELQALRQALQAQQQQIQELMQRTERMQQELQRRDQALQQTRQELQQVQSAANDARNRAIAVETSTGDQTQKIRKLEANFDDVRQNVTNSAVQTQEEQKRTSALESVLGRFRFSGDIRVRQEDFFQSYDGCNGRCNPRIRERFRARFGLEGKLNEDFTAGFYLASGAITDPTSTNETLSNVFERKTIAVDRAYVNYSPTAAKWLTLTGGKFAFTWIRTPQTFDSDLNPEGFSEKLSFDLSSPVLKNVTFTGMQLLYNEVNRPASAASCVSQVCVNAGSLAGGDAFAAGGQASAKLQLSKRWSLAPSYTILNWRNNDVILNETAAVTGGSAGQFAPNGITNATVTLGTVGGATIRRFHSKFLYSDLILDNSISTGWKKLPTWRVVLEYLDNLNAQDHPLLADGTVATSLGKQSHLYKVETTLGQTKNKGDFQFAYGFWRQEQDSVIASFIESDQRAPTNILQHSFGVQYKVRSNTTLSYTQWIGRTLNRNLQNAVLAPGLAVGVDEPYLKRMQFDVVYSF